MYYPSIMALTFSSYFAGGPTPKFSLFHIWKAYSVIESQGPVGRKALADILQIGEGSTRTILDKMIREGCVENTRRGAVLTERGKKRLDSSGIVVAPVNLEGLTIGKHDCAVLTKGMADRIKTGCEQRDEAVRAGAIGASTLIVKDGRIVFPCDDGYPDQDLVAPLRRIFALEEGDAVIIGSGYSYETAEKGAVAAALSIGNLTRRGWNDGSGLMSSDAEAEDLSSLALAIHELVGRMPVAMRSRNHYGVRCEDGEVIDTNYTGPLLEEALKKNQILRKSATTGPYRGTPIVVVPITRKKEAIAALGVVDMTKGSIFDVMNRARKER
jgi:predicted transcriptional regulator